MADVAVSPSKGLLIGLSAHADGLRLLATKPLVLLHCLPGALLAVSCALSTSLLVWALAFVFRLPPMQWEVPFDLVLRCVCNFVFNLSTIFASFSGRSFFAAYRALTPADAKALQKQRILHGLFGQLRQLAQALLAGLGIVVLLAGTAVVWVPGVLAAATAASGALAALVLTPGGLAILIGGFGCTLLLRRVFAPALSLFLTLRRSVSLRLAAFIALLALCGALPPAAARFLIEGTSCLFLALLHAKQLLAQYSIRMEASAWCAWCADTRWALVGFGLPIVGVVRRLGSGSHDTGGVPLLHPLAALCVLELAHLSAAALLHRLGEGRDLTVQRGLARKGGAFEFLCVRVREGWTVGELAHAVRARWQRELAMLTTPPADFREGRGAEDGAWRVRFITRGGQPLADGTTLREAKQNAPDNQRGWFFGDHANSMEFEHSGVKAYPAPVPGRSRA